MRPWLTGEWATIAQTLRSLWRSPGPSTFVTPHFDPGPGRKNVFSGRAFFSGVSWGWMENRTQARQGCEGGFGLVALRGAPWGWSDPGVEFWPNGSVLLAFWHSRFFQGLFLHTPFFQQNHLPSKKEENVCVWVGPCSAERERQNEGEKSGFLSNWVSFKQQIRIKPVQ